MEVLDLIVPLGIFALIFSVIWNSCVIIVRQSEGAFSTRFFPRAPLSRSVHAGGGRRRRAEAARGVGAYAGLARSYARAA